MAVKWTKEQRQVIDLRDRNIRFRLLPVQERQQYSLRGSSQ